jgi:hypothetical protein
MTVLEKPDGAVPIEEQTFICGLHKNESADGGDFWLHDCCAFAIYLCAACTGATTLYNQA